MKSSLKQQILVTLIVVGLVPLLVLFAYTRIEIGDALRESEKERVSEINDQLASHLRLLMEGAANDLANIQTNPIIADASKPLPARKREMERIIAHYDNFFDISLYGKDGYVLAYTNEDRIPAPKDYTEWFKQALAGKVVMSHPDRSLGEDMLFLNVYLPLYANDGSGEVQSVMVARQEFKGVITLLESSTPGDGGNFVLLDKGLWKAPDDPGTVLCTSEGGVQNTQSFETDRTFEFWRENPEGIYRSPQGVDYFYAANHIKSSEVNAETEWILLALQPCSSVEAMLASARKALGVTTLISLLIAIILGLIISHIIARHVVNLSKSARKVAGGDLGVKVEAKGFKEVRELAESFNLMVAELNTHQNRLSELVRQRTEKYRESQEKLKLTTARLQAAFNSSQDGILVTDCDHQIVVGNPVFKELLDLPTDIETSGLTESDLRDHLVRQIKNKRDARDFLEAMMKPDAVFEKEINLVEDQNGNDYRVAALFTTPIKGDASNAGGRLWVLRDLTEKRLLEEKIRHSVKMDAIGTLAGGVAHDFNNLLTGITGHLSLLDMENLGDNHRENKELLGSAIHASNRATDLVTKLLGFSRQSHIELRACNAHDVVKEVYGILANSVDPNVVLDLSGLPDSPWPILSDPSLINSVVMNMSVNAVDAMPGGGVLKFTSENRTVTEEEAKGYLDAQPGDYLCLTIEDNGDGIPESVQKKIFEPFFTTKEQGKGTGLGLATCFGIVQQLGGWITFESEVGVGTTFRIFLPRCADMEKVKKDEKKKVAISEGRGETLLLVDDEHVVRSVAEKLLSKLGYNILTASDGEEAIEIFEKGEHKIDLVLLDMTMPKKSGSDTFTEMRDRFDHVPVLICSGYLVDLSTFQTKLGSVPEGFVQKPYEVETMASTVRRTIDNFVKDSDAEAA